MASSSSLCLCLVLFCSLVIFATPSLAKTSLKPKALVLPVAKHAATLKYLTSIKQRTPLVSVRLILDLGGDFLWVDCEKDYVSSTYKPSRCKSAQCKLANSNRCFECLSSQRPGCHNNTCSLMPSQTVLGTAGNDGQLGQDHVSLHSTDGTHPGKLVSVPNFLFICSQTYLLENLPTAVKGFAGLGRDKIGIPSQFASAFGFSKKFALCLPSSTRSYGAVFFGPGPYVAPQLDVSKSLTYTPLLLNPFTTAPAYVEGKPSAEYFINVTSIKMNGLTLPLNASLLVFDQYGYGGTKVSTVNPYTVLESSIFNTLNWAFLKVLPAPIPRLGSIAPFRQCFNSSHIGENDVPSIDLVLQSDSVYWRLSRANSMVQVKKDVMCLAFVDAGQSPGNPRTSIVIGGHQLENNLLQFDLVNKRFGFSSSLLSQKTSCSNFNFTSTA